MSLLSLKNIDGTKPMSCFGKKILIVSNNAFSSMHNNGKTAKALFSGFPKETIAQLFFNHNETPDFDVCDNYFKITDTDVFKNIILPNKYGGRYSQVNEYIPKSDFITTQPPKLSEGNSKLFLLLKSVADDIALFRDYLWKFNSWKTKKLFAWIEEFSPTTIFFLVGSPGYPQDVVNFICQKYKLPLIVYFTDDYIIHSIPSNFINKIRKFLMHSVYKRTVRDASLCFAIGDQMCDEYEKYFGKKFYPIMNSVKILPYNINDEDIPVINISYFGGLTLNRWKMLIEFGNLIKELQVKFDKKIELNVYSTTELTTNVLDLFKENNVTYKGCAIGDSLFKAFSSATFFIHVENDEHFSRCRVKLSISTKIPEYLMMGKLIIAYGPPEVASFRLLSDNNIGVVLSSDNSREFNINILEELLNDRKKQIMIAKKGYEFAVDNFDMEKNQKSFMDKVLSV